MRIFINLIIKNPQFSLQYRSNIIKNNTICLISIISFISALHNFAVNLQKINKQNKINHQSNNSNMNNSRLVVTVRLSLMRMEKK